MFRLRNLAILVSVFYLGLTPALAQGNEAGERGEDMGPPPAPESLRPIFQKFIDSGELSEGAKSILLFLNLPLEDREGVEPPMPGENEGADIKEELMGLFKNIVAGGGLAEDANEYLKKMVEHMSQEEHRMGGQGMGGGQGQGGGQDKMGRGQGQGGGQDKMGRGQGQGGGQDKMGRGGEGPKAELPEATREQLQAIREMYREAMELERTIRSGGKPSEDMLATRNEIVQSIVDHVVELLDDAEVSSDNAPLFLRLLGPSFGPMRGPDGGQGGQGDGMGG